MAIKLDMAKAYDRVEWHFLQAMMQKMGFCPQWINWITSCMKSVTYSFNCNGEIKGFVTPGRGIRQGDPLSPYLFLIRSEGFSSLLRKAEGRNEIKGLRISRQGPIITHLFFADDSLIFCKASIHQANEIMKLLKTYEEASGQLINLDKSAIFFSKNMNLEQRKEICSALGGMVEMTQEKYLGLPMVITRTKDQVFGFIRDNIRRKLQDWKNKLLSTASKEVMLKVVSMAMPTYAMFCFNCQGSCAKTLLHLWLTTGARSLVEKGVIKRIGNGKSTNIWEYKWIPGSSSGKPSTPRPLNSSLKIVHELIIQKRWDRNTIFRVFNQSDGERILSIPISSIGREDSYFWQHNAGGCYSVSSGYKLLMEENNSTEKAKLGKAGPSIMEESQQLKQIWNTLWKLNIKHKIKLFIWKCIKGALPVREAIFRRTGMGDSICRACGESQEIVEHLLLNCPNTLDIWKVTPIQWDGARDQQGDFKRWWSKISEAKTRLEGAQHIGLTANILQVWKERNKKDFENQNRCPPVKTMNKAQKEWMKQEKQGKTKDSMSTGEIAVNQTVHQQEHEDEGIIILEVNTTSQQRQPSFGVGAIARTYQHTRIVEWALKERTLGTKILDDAVAVKLVLSKAMEQHWDRIKILFHNKELLRQLRHQSSSESRLATLVDDITELQKMFCMCSFELVSEENMTNCKRLSFYALGILVNEEWYFPQCT
ncbi:uncharacterized protein [Coffea arabica]|uniref:Reverse transcriptase domain-containing protein n=1 Tax=Coffea arabica TaxID=13443 RepID=A0A6P6V8E4_COFAR|nr:uncharacterized protein LOC113718557 [Coffea arabica]